MKAKDMFELLMAFGLGAIITYYTITHYNHIKAFFFDAISGISFLGKWVRRKDVESKYENVINGAVNEFNSNFENKIIPNCQIKWINKDTERGYFENEKAIICLKFDKKDQDLNFYNATYSFTKTALLPNTRDFVKGDSQKAIDLNLTKIFIKNNNRNALKVFNQQYKSEEQEVKNSFVRFEETEKRGLFSTLLIPELHYLGETLATATPTEKIEKEIEEFFDWFYDLATRGKEEKTILNYRSEHIKVGVILVANIETYESFGIEAYTKWADKYASDHYGAVYLLARGKKRAGILKEVVNELSGTKGFDQINKRVTMFEVDEYGEQIEISVYCLKPNLAKVQYNAWEKIKACYNSNKKLNAIVSEISTDGIFANIYGINFEISKNKLSSKEIPNLSRFFYVDQELILNIENLDIDKCLLEINNIDTETDPNILIETALKENQIIKVVINGVQVDREGKERGLRTYSRDLNRKVFIPKKNCSYSRFIRLDSSFTKGDEIEILLHGFSMEFANFVGEIKGLQNPLTNFHEYQENHQYSGIVQEVTENYLTTEIIPGLECRIYRSELSWEDDANTQDYNIGDKVDLIIIRSDSKRYQLTGSIKRIQRSEKEEFYKANIDKTFTATVTKVYPGVGLKFKISDNNYIGFVYVQELMWGFCSNIIDNFPINSNISVKPIDFDYQNNEIRYSIKACMKNQFDEAVDELIIGENYKGKVIRHFTDLARIQIQSNGFAVQGYIHKSEISNIAFLENEDISSFLPLDSEFTFKLKRRDNKNKIIELSRKSVVSSDFSEIEYGDTIDVKIVKRDANGAYFYEDDCEGVITENYDNVSIGEEKEAYLINSNGEFSL
jgi:small subunit ribosomal protein S1